MALFSECRAQCAQTVLDTADIVRDGDITPTDRYGSQTDRQDAQLLLALLMENRFPRREIKTAPFDIRWLQE